MHLPLAVTSIRPLAARARVRGRSSSPTRSSNPTRSSAAASFSTSFPRRHDHRPYGPVGIAHALALASASESQCPRATSPASPAPGPTIFTHEFSLADRVALVTGANRELGLEIALALVEAGARGVYCVDLPKTLGEDWEKVRRYVGGALEGRTGGDGRIEYVCADVRDQASAGC